MSTVSTYVLIFGRISVSLIPIEKCRNVRTCQLIDGDSNKYNKEWYATIFSYRISIRLVMKLTRLLYEVELLLFSIEIVHYEL